MTPEEKAKAYDEALERARQIRDGKDEWRYSDLAEITPALTDIFPQLCESEDERTKRMLNTITYKMSQHQPDIFTEEENEWFNAYLEKQKQEWSEEDEKMLDSVIRIITQFDDLAHEPTFAGPKWTHPYTKEIAWLKSLPLNLKKKNEDVAKLCSNEWSEKEYGRLFDIEHYLNGTLQLSTDRKIACIDFLKSLRPSWKPSEEQVQALEYVIRDYREDRCNATANYLQEILDHFKNM